MRHLVHTNPLLLPLDTTPKRGTQGQNDEIGHHTQSRYADGPPNTPCEPQDPQDELETTIVHDPRTETETETEDESQQPPPLIQYRTP